MLYPNSILPIHTYIRHRDWHTVWALSYRSPALLQPSFLSSHYTELAPVRYSQSRFFQLGLHNLRIFCSKNYPISLNSETAGCRYQYNCDPLKLSGAREVSDKLLQRSKQTYVLPVDNGCKQYRLSSLTYEPIPAIKTAQFKLLFYVTRLMRYGGMVSSEFNTTRMSSAS